LTQLSSIKEKAVRASTERLISATAGSRPVPSLNFGEVREAWGLC
jgi:hypothetical protein